MDWLGLVGSAAMGKRHHLLSRDERETKQPIGSPCRLSRAAHTLALAIHTHDFSERYSELGSEAHTLVERLKARRRDERARRARERRCTARARERHHKKPLPPTPKFGFGFALEEGDYGRCERTRRAEAPSHHRQETSRRFPASRFRPCLRGY